MCFGQSQTQTQNTTYTPNPQVASAADQSLTAAQNLQNAGYTAYTGNRVADFTPLQESGFNDAAGAVNGTNPFYSTSADLMTNYATTPGASVTPNTISSQMQPYMNQFVSEALQPQIAAQDQQFAAQDQNLNAAATESGAFGDDRAGIQAANLTQNQDIARTGLIGQAYANAFNTAIGAGAQDVGNQLNAGEFNANNFNNTLNREMTGAQGLEGLYGTNLADIANQYGLSATAGGTQQQEAQAELNVPYSNYLAAQQYPFLTSQNLNASVATGAGAMPASSTAVTTQPNNSGFALLGALAPALFNGGSGGFASSALGMGLGLISDERDKEDVKEVGKLNDGQKIYSFRYKGDPTKTTHIGLIAQQVKKRHPAAVTEIGGHMRVNYDRATAFAAAVGAHDYKMAA